MNYRTIYQFHAFWSLPPFEIREGACTAGVMNEDVGRRGLEEAVDWDAESVWTSTTSMALWLGVSGDEV